MNLINGNKNGTAEKTLLNNAETHVSFPQNDLRNVPGALSANTPLPRRGRGILRKKDGTLEEIDLPIPIPAGATLHRNGKYLSICNCHGYPIASLKGRVPYHRFVLYESLNRPRSAICCWCQYPLAWTNRTFGASYAVVNADHLDGNTTNNEPSNLVPSCSWCNANRTWAEAHPEFWERCRRWMRDVPPMVRPNLPEIAKELGLSTPQYYEEE